MAFDAVPNVAVNVPDTRVVYVAIVKPPLPIRNDVEDPLRLILFSTKALVLLTKAFTS